MVLLCRALWLGLCLALLAGEVLTEGDLENTIDIDTLDETDIFDVVKNFIAEKDPILQLYLSLCFLHPRCYQLELPPPQEDEGPAPPPRLESREARRVWDHLLARRTESARGLLVGIIGRLRAVSKGMMFRYMQQGVAARGVSVAATKMIIDSVKAVWKSVDRDLVAAQSSVEEIFYLQSFESESQRRTLLDVVGSLLAIPRHIESLYQAAAARGYRDYVHSGSWDSWKRAGSSLA